ncbi:DNA-binding response regulator [Halalkalibacter wakoensis JCM 9140]|uniref:DNA-binding response regulator n=1 Tax=Halalkalibacter wakoensis JCM 9140 TaxID=1236970 RepID=W4Q458_9BACI|nr:AraC family transcriptional regulator [Halalkalibacter wakoensis]GAE26740.1 DNA-binding response regulator [Halalkalibacter wakoensis JCM 9140]
MRVLVLDDEPLELDQIEILIHDHFPTWVVKKAQNYTEAMEVVDRSLQEDQPMQLALIDVKLPGRNGLEVAEKIKARIPQIDFIVVSAFQNFDYAKKSIQLKVVDYLVKPVIEKEFVTVLQSYVHEHPEYEIHSEVVQKMIRIVQSSYQDSLKLSDIAKELHMNANYMSRLFSEEVGKSFSDYLLGYRIEMAKSLLVKHKDWSIQRVAEDCGFNSQHYFSTTFKKLVNQTPKAFRK